MGRAYVQAKYNQTVWQWVWDKLLRKPQPIPSGAAKETFGWHGVAIGYAPHYVDITLSLHEQIKRLAAYVNNKARQAAEMERKINEIQQDLMQARHETSALERKALARIETRINELSKKLNRIQVLDLRPAIWGLFVSFVGIVFSFGT